MKSNKSKLSIENKLTIIDSVSIQRLLNELNTDKETLPLSKAEEISLFNEYKLTGSEKIKTRIIKSNLRFIITIAKQFVYEKAEVVDLFNEGVIGLIKAFDKFDVTKGFRFLTFATWNIRQAMGGYTHDILADIVQPGNRYRINTLIKKATKILKLQGVDVPEISQLVEVYNKIKEPVDPKMTDNLLLQIRLESKSFISMNTPVSNGNDATELVIGDTYQASSNYNADALINISDKHKHIRSMLKSCGLNEREVEIIEYSYGLNNKEEKTIEQIGELLGYTRERIGQIQKKAKNKLKAKPGIVRELCGGASFETISVTNTK